MCYPEIFLILPRSWPLANNLVQRIPALGGLWDQTIQLGPFGSWVQWLPFNPLWSWWSSYSVSHSQHTLLKHLLSFLHWPSCALLCISSRIRMPVWSLALTSTAHTCFRSQMLKKMLTVSKQYETKCWTEIKNLWLWARKMKNSKLWLHEPNPCLKRLLPGTWKKQKQQHSLLIYGCTSPNRARYNVFISS